jgi:TRAP transporter TAXI family solute receptor
MLITFASFGTPNGLLTKLICKPSVSEEKKGKGDRNMKTRKTCITAMMLSFLIGIVFFSVDSGAATKFLTIGSTSTSSSHYSYFVAVAKIINDNVPGVNATVVATGASVDNLKRMAKGQADLGLVTLDAGYMAYHGLGSWKESPFKKQRVMWLYLTTAVHYVVREDSGVKTLYDLNKKKFHPGMRGSASEASAMAILKILGVEPEYHRGDTGDAVAAVKDNRIAGISKSGLGKGFDASIMDIATSTPVRVLEFTDKEIKKVSAEMPYTSWITVPAGTIKGMGEFRTVANVNFVIGVEDIPEEIGYKVVKAICGDMDTQVAAFPGMKGLNIPKATLEAVTSVSNPLPLHPGTVKYFNELGLKVPKDLIPPK